MPTTDPATVHEVMATDRATLERHLDHAEMLARKEAMKTRRGGVLITRHSLNSFTVEVSEAVPYGLTREQSLLVKPR